VAADVGQDESRQDWREKRVLGFAPSATRITIPGSDGVLRAQITCSNMTDQETIARFIFLRSQGWSFNRIQAELNVSKPTLIKWGCQHQFEIANLRATETEALAESVFRQRHERWEVLARQLKRLEEEIEKRDLEEIPASRLHAIAAALRAEIKQETGQVRFAETCKRIPHEEFVYDREEWSV
jgi:transposase